MRYCSRTGLILFAVVKKSCLASKGSCPKGRNRAICKYNLRKVGVSVEQQPQDTFCSESSEISTYIFSTFFLLGSMAKHFLIDKVVNDDET
jgi:hypothetical protein